MDSFECQQKLDSFARTIQAGLLADSPWKKRTVGPVWSQGGIKLIWRGPDFAWPWCVELDGVQFGLIYPTSPRVLPGLTVTYRVGRVLGEEVQKVRKQPKAIQVDTLEVVEAFLKDRLEGVRLMVDKGRKVILVAPLSLGDQKVHRAVRYCLVLGEAPEWDRAVRVAKAFRKEPVLVFSQPSGLYCQVAGKTERLGKWLTT